MDFTLKTYNYLISVFQSRKFIFNSFKFFMENSNNVNLIIRHDVDRLPYNALQMAKLENSLNIKGTYYFRIVPKSYNEEVINYIMNMGHEIGYHY